MSFSYSFRDRPRLSDRIRGKSGDELFKELRKELDKDRTSFFDSPTSNLGSSTGSTFPRAGHLFDEPLMRGHTDIRSHLEDLAHRHPEFADQLRYPAWSNDHRSNTWGRKRRGSGHHDLGETSNPQPQQETSQPETTEEPGPLRGRAKDNLRNTVPDMGQKQQQEAEEKESRGQRSWSAPPDNRTQQSEKPRFVSKIEIHPVNPDAVPSQTGDATKPPMAPPKPQTQPQQQQQTQSQSKSNVRHIPIFVEGRDEPVLPKNIEPEFTQSQAPPQHFSRPPPHQQFTPPHQQYVPQPQFSPPQHHFQPQFEPPQFSPPHHFQPQFEPSPPRYEQPPPQPKPEPPPPQQPEQQQPESPPMNPRDPLYRVDCVQKEVDELKGKVESFSGNSRSDKDYILLDELLTRSLIKLDDVDTEGKDEVRTARKNTIKSIQRCISILENKVPLPFSEKKGAEVMDVTSEVMAEGIVDNQQLELTSDQSSPMDASGDKQLEVENQVSQETNKPGATEVPSTEKDVTSEVSKEPTSTEALENKTA